MSLLLKRMLSKEVIDRFLEMFRESGEMRERLCEKIMIHFPFDELDEISFVFDKDMFSSCLKIIGLLINCNVFYYPRNLDIIKNIFQFLVKGVWIEDIEKDVIINIIDIINIIVTRISKNKFLQERAIDKIKLLETMEFIINYPRFNIDFKESVVIVMLDYILISKVPVGFDIFTRILDYFFNSNNYSVIIKMCNTICQNFPFQTEICVIILRNILRIASLVCYKNIDEEITFSIFSCINQIYYNTKILKGIWNSELKKEYTEFISNVTEYTDQICILYCKLKSNLEYAKILVIIIEEFANSGHIILNKPHNMFNELKCLGESIENWPVRGTKLFFHICHILCKYNRLLWNPNAIVDAMKLIVFKIQNPSVNIEIFKSICFIFPFIMVDCLDIETVSVGKTILEIISLYRPRMLKQLINFHIGQLVWMLYNGNEDLKMQCLLIWLELNEDVKLISNAIRRTRGQRIILKILMTTSDDNMVSKCNAIIKRIRDEDMFVEIGGYILSANETLLSRLLQCKPKAPSNKLLRMDLCQYFSKNLQCLSENKILKSAIIYSRQLLGHNCNNEDNILWFLKCTSTLRELSENLEKIDEETTVEVLKFLNMLVHLQHRNDLKSPETIKIQLHKSLEGNPEKINLAISLLVSIIDGNAFLNLDDSFILDIHHNVRNVCIKPGITSKSFKILGMILSRYNWLLQVPSVNIFIEYFCFTNEKSMPFTKYLILYLKLMIHHPEINVNSLPKDSIVKNFILRSSLSSKIVKYRRSK